jgi:hypothetical protein
MSEKEELIIKIIFYAIQKGDQDLWNILVDYLKDYRHLYPKLLERFAHVILTKDPKMELVKALKELTVKLLPLGRGS